MAASKLAVRKIADRNIVIPELPRAFKPGGSDFVPRDVAIDKRQLGSTIFSLQPPVPHAATIVQIRS